MRPIPKSVRDRLSDDPLMAACCVPGCFRRPEWHHAVISAGRQVSEWWAIVPLCPQHHRLGRKWHRFAKAVALMRASDSELGAVGKGGLLDERDRLAAEFGEEYDRLINERYGHE